jgi:hypothetical protein
MNDFGRFYVVLAAGTAFWLAIDFIRKGGGR